MFIIKRNVIKCTKQLTPLFYITQNFVSKQQKQLQNEQNNSKSVVFTVKMESPQVFLI